MSLRNDWLSRQFVRIDADVRDWPISMKVEAGFATGEQTGQGLSRTSKEEAAAVEITHREPDGNGD